MRPFTRALLLTLLFIATPLPAHGGGAAEQDRQAARLHFEQGNGYCKAQEWDRAIAEYLEANRLYPAPAFLFNIAEVHRFAGHWKAAIEYYFRFLRAEPAGELHDAAAATVARLVQVRSEEVRQHRERARIAIEKREYDQAVAAYQTAYELESDPALLLAIGDAYRLSSDVPKALAAYRKYLSEAPEGEEREHAQQLIAELEPRARAAAPPGAPAFAPQGQIGQPSGPGGRPSGGLARVSRHAWLWGAIGGSLVAAGVVIAGAVAGAPRDPTPSLGTVSLYVGGR